MFGVLHLSHLSPVFRSSSLCAFLPLEAIFFISAGLCPLLSGLQTDDVGVEVLGTRKARPLPVPRKAD